VMPSYCLRCGIPHGGSCLRSDAVPPIENEPVVPGPQHQQGEHHVPLDLVADLRVVPDLLEQLEGMDEMMGDTTCRHSASLASRGDR